MKIALSWLREYVQLPDGITAEQIDAALNNLGVEVESVVDQAATVKGDLVVGRVLTIEELTGFKKPIRFCTLDIGASSPEGGGKPQEVICGATNFAAGDLVPVILPGGELPGGFAVSSRRVYGRVSHGMICSGRELGVSEDHTGIIVLDPASGAVPGEDARPYVGLDDIIIEVEITPDRGYQMSARGLARELSHAFGRFTDPGRVRAPKGTKTPAWPVTVVDKIGCDRFCARLVTGIDPSAPTPDFMARRLTIAGIRVLGLPIDITNYVMLELGQPMHAFDADRITGPLVVRRAAPGESMTTLDGVHRELSEEDMVICDAGLTPDNPEAGVPVSLAAVMGGQTSEVVPGVTTNVLFEAAHWDPTMVSRTARRHRLFSEAAKRWERGVDREVALVALDRATKLLTKYGGGKASRSILDLNYPTPVASITMPADRPARLAGVPYSTERIVQLLEQVGCTVSVSAPEGPHDTAGDGVPEGTAAMLTVTPPSWRPDLVGPADLTEEVVRLDGYDRVPSALPVAPPGNGLTASQRRRRSVGRTLAEQGYVETLCYPFVSAEVLERLGMPVDGVRLANPLSDEEPLLRPSLLPPLLSALRRNVGRGQKDVALFEQGLVFRPRPGGAVPPIMGTAHRPSDEQWAAANAAVPDQPWHVAVVLAGEFERSGWWGAGRPGDWSDAIQAARDVLAAAGVPASAVRVSAAATNPWHPGRCAAIAVDGPGVVGHAGELHPSVCADLDLPRRTCAMELNLDAVPLPGVTAAPTVSTFPPALIDVALVVDAEVPAAAVQDALVEGAGSLLEAVRLFDIYTGEQVGPGRKSLAYKLTFRAKDRTLKAEEAVAARDAAVAVAAERLGATLRGT